MATAKKVSFVILLMICISPIAIIAALVAYFSGIPTLLPFICAVYIGIGVLLTVRIFTIPKNKKPIFIVTFVIVVLTFVISIPGIYDITRPVVADGDIDISAYEPFSKNAKLVKLDEPSNLKITSELPVIDGATALYPVYSAFAQAVYPKKSYDPYESSVMVNRTGAAYENLLSGYADIIFVLAPSESQLALAKEMGKEMKLTPIGKEAFVFFVNSKNPVKSLTVDEIKGIYSGKLTNWNEVGGKKNNIRAFQRPEDSGSQTALQYFMADTPIMDPPVEDIATLMGTIVDEVSAYKNYNNAIGYTFRYYSTEMIQSNNIRLLQVNGVEPTVKTIQSEEYPITNEIYAVTAGSTNPHVQELIDWILSAQGQGIIEKTGYAPLQ